MGILTAISLVAHHAFAAEFDVNKPLELHRLAPPRLHQGAVAREIAVAGWQAKEGSFRANGSSLTLPDGSRLFLESSIV